MRYFKVYLCNANQTISKSSKYYCLSKVKVKLSQSCLTLCDPMAYTVREILLAKTLQWGAFPFSRGSSQPRDRTQVSHTAGGFFTSWATREAQVTVYGVAEIQTHDWARMHMDHGRGTVSSESAVTWEESRKSNPNCILLVNRESLSASCPRILCFFFLNWFVIALQCCLSLRFTAKWLSCMHTYVSSFIHMSPPAQTSLLQGPFRRCFPPTTF